MRTARLLRGESASLKLMSTATTGVAVTALAAVVIALGGLSLAVIAGVVGCGLLVASPVLLARRRVRTALAAAGLGVVAVAPLAGLVWLAAHWAR